MSKLEQKNAIVWFTGQPGSGKTTLAREFIDKLCYEYSNPDSSRTRFIHIDGDEIRMVLATNDSTDYGRSGRVKNIQFAIDTSIFLVSKGFVPVVSLVSPYRYLREQLKIIGKGTHYKKEQPRFEVLEVYCHTTEIRGKEKYFSDEYEPPLQNFLDMDTTDKTIEECVDEILDVYR
jgi:adenylylsulfate kinase